jgi:hypothetical protein
VHSHCQMCSVSKTRAVTEAMNVLQQCSDAAGLLQCTPSSSHSMPTAAMYSVRELNQQDMWPV